MYACADSACFVALEPDLELLGSAWLGSPQLRRRGKKPSATAAAEISLRGRTRSCFCRANLLPGFGDAPQLNKFASPPGLDLCDAAACGNCAHKWMLPNEVM